MRDNDLWNVPDHWVSHCAKCGREGLKRNMVTLYVKDSGGKASMKKLCHICNKCLPDLLEELEVSMP